MATQTIDPGYVTRAEALKILKKSKTTLEGLVRDKRVESIEIPRAGKRPERVYLESSLREVAKTLNAPPRPATEIARTKPDNGVALLLAARDTEARRLELQTKPWLNIEEACRYSGLGIGAILHAITAGKLVGGKWGPHGALVVKRKSLEEFGG